MYASKMDQQPCRHMTVKRYSRLNLCKKLKVCGMCFHRSMWPLKKMIKCVDCKIYMHSRCLKNAKTETPKPKPELISTGQKPTTTISTLNTGQKPTSMISTLSTGRKLTTTISNFSTGQGLKVLLLNYSKTETPKPKPPLISTVQKLTTTISTLSFQIFMYRRWLKNSKTEMPKLKPAMISTYQKPMEMISAFTLFGYLLRHKELEETKERKLNSVASPVASAFHVKSRFTKDDYLLLSSTWERLDKRRKGRYSYNVEYIHKYFTSTQDYLLFSTTWKSSLNGKKVAIPTVEHIHKYITQS